MEVYSIRGRELRDWLFYEKGFLYKTTYDKSECEVYLFQYTEHFDRALALYFEPKKETLTLKENKYLLN